MKSLSYLISLLLIISVYSCKESSTQPVSVGLKVYKDYDQTRKFDTTGKAKSFFRPVKIDVFYPSTETPTQEPVTYGNILDLYSNRMDYSLTADSCGKASKELAKVIGDYIGIKDENKLLNHKLKTFLNLKTPTTKYPLIIYSAGMNGSTWENPLLFEHLAANGYVVAVVSSVGLFPGFMTEAIDLEEQVKDILYTAKKMKALAFVDSNKIGLLSWSLGGSAAGKAAMRSTDFKCLLSFDGTEIHYYGNDEDWDKQYDKILAQPDFKPQAITGPYLYLSSEHPKNPDSVSNLLKVIASKEKQFLKFNNAIHENFSSLPVLGKPVEPKAKDLDSGRHETVKKLTLTFFNQYLKSERVSIADTIKDLSTKSSSKYSKDLP